MKKIAIAAGLAVALTTAAAASGAANLQRIEHGSQAFQDAYMMGPVYRFMPGEDESCAEMPSIPTFHANFGDVSEYFTTGEKSAFIVVTQSDFGDEPAVYAYSNSKNGCEAIRASYPTAGERVPTPHFSGGIITIGQGRQEVLLNQRGRCDFGEGDGSFVNMPIFGKGYGAGCWTQQGHIIILNVRAIYNGETGYSMPANFEVVVDVPDIYYH